MTSSAQTKTIYLAKPTYLMELIQELTKPYEVIDNLILTEQQNPTVSFALDVWHDVQIVSFQSISEAARILRQAGKFWYLYPISHIRRSHLIHAELRKLPDLSHTFPLQSQLPPIGCFSLLDQNTLLYSVKRWKNPPLGDFNFIEDKTNPPNRAYLKLWEALSLLGRYPTAGETAIDLGASPGGWSYVIQSLGAHVTAVDKAPLDPHVAALPNVSFRKDSAFAIAPEEFDQPLDWLLSDVACYPERLYELALRWIEAKKAKQLIFTLKLQGETNLPIIEKFQAIPNARVIHLFHNKHEATFFYPASSALYPF